VSEVGGATYDFAHQAGITTNLSEPTRMVRRCRTTNVERGIPKIRLPNRGLRVFPRSNSNSTTRGRGGYKKQWETCIWPQHCYLPDSGVWWRQCGRCLHDVFGFQRVIMPFDFLYRTMQDTYGPEIAGVFFGHLLHQKDGHSCPALPDLTQSARALHLAVLRLCPKVPFIRWVPFVHDGL
jgi:hypothetical protein